MQIDIKLCLDKYFVATKTALVAESSILCNCIFFVATNKRHFYNSHKSHTILDFTLKALE
ncbi:hypothetical protein D0A34_02755 [Microcoleus vaginatus PCC 9802]|nr:hypothetical protein MicvaDRAFT_2923 [Microcoleus vaginatus FGP-2]UNU17923.1 hypothetical protein D0A34_02755 [Microcoleus vaginatus PCC 9802]